MLICFCTYQVELCTECIEWAKEEKRTFLRQALEVGEIVTFRYGQGNKNQGSVEEQI